MAAVTCLENFYACRASRRLRIDDGSEPATGDGGGGDRGPRRFDAGPVAQGQLPAERVNGKPVNVPVIRRAGRIIADRAFAVVRLARPLRKMPRGNIRGLRAN